MKYKVNISVSLDYIVDALSEDEAEELAKECFGETDLYDMRHDMDVDVEEYDEKEQA